MNLRVSPLFHVARSFTANLIRRLASEAMTVVTAREVMAMRVTSELKHPRPVSLILAELRQELKESFDTRIAILKAEYREKLAHIKIATPLAALGVVLLLTAYFLITLAVVALVRAFIHNDFRWAIAFGFVGAVWGILGGLAVYVAKREFELNRLAPQKTLEVLRGDKAWLQQEVRNQYEHSASRDVAA